MATSPPQAVDGPDHSIPSERPSYLVCRRAIGRLHRYQDLVRHHQGWAGEAEKARPLAKLIPGLAKGPLSEHSAIEREINRLGRVVWSDVRSAGVNTSLVLHNGRPAVDFISNYHSLPRAQGSNYQVLMIMLDESIGSLEAMQARALREALNPLNWIAGVLRAPVYVLERAGFIHKGSPLHPWAAKAVIIGTLYILVKLAGRLFGFGADWKSIIDFLK
jgi:hypothetical protein